MRTRIAIALSLCTLALPAGAVADGGHGMQIPATVGKTVSVPAPPPPKAGQVITPAFNPVKLRYLGRATSPQGWTFRFIPKVAGRMNVILQLRARPKGKQVGHLAMVIVARRG